MLSFEKLALALASDLGEVRDVMNGACLQIIFTPAGALRLVFAFFFCISCLDFSLEVESRHSCWPQVKGRYVKDHHKLEVQPTGRYFVNMLLDNLISAKYVGPTGNQD